MSVSQLLELIDSPDPLVHPYHSSYVWDDNTQVRPSNITPESPGVYATLQAFSTQWTWSYWDGKRWGLSALTPKAAAKREYREYSGADQSKCWKGIRSYGTLAGERRNFPMKEARA